MPLTGSALRCIRIGLLAVIAPLVWMAVGPVPSAAAQGGAVSREDGIRILRDVRTSVDRTLDLLKKGQEDQAFAEARTGYLMHFEQVEVPLRVADNDLTITAEGLFAEIRQAIRSGAPTSEVTAKVTELRRVLDDAERKLTTLGAAAPALVFGQSFLILFREGFEVVLLVSVLLGYLEAARAPQFIRPIMSGIAVAVAATVATVVGMRSLFGALPVSQELLEAVTALVAVAMLFYVSFWLISRMEQRRWMEFVKARLWSAVSLGSTASLMVVGFTAVYREGFETALFYQSLLSFGAGMGWWIAAGIATAAAALVVVAFLTFRLGRRLPVRTFMNAAVVLVMVTSVAFLGNAIHALQAADVIGYNRLPSWWQPPIFVSQATGYWPTVQSVLAQVLLATVYLLGAAYTFVLRPRLAARDRSGAPHRQVPAAAST